MAGLLYNPMFNAGMGLLAAGGPSRFPVGLGQALSRGLLQAQNANIAGSEIQDRQQANALRAQQIQMQMEAARQQEEQMQQRNAAMQQLRGLLTPEQAALVDAGVPVDKVAQAAGLLGSAGMDPTSAMQEYEFARSQGFDGSFLDYKAAMAAAGRPVTNVTTPVSVFGSGYEPQTPQGKQAADLVYLVSQRANMEDGSPQAEGADRAIAAIRAEMVPKFDSSGLQGQVLQGEEGIAKLDAVMEQFSPSLMTLQGRAGTSIAGAKDRVGIASEEDKARITQWTKFTNGVESIFNAYRRDVTGAAASVQELEMLKRAMLNSDQSPTAFQASYDLFREASERFLNAKRRVIANGMDPRTEEGARALDAEYAGAAPARPRSAIPTDYGTIPSADLLRAIEAPLRNM